MAILEFAAVNYGIGVNARVEKERAEKKADATLSTDAVSTTQVNLATDASSYDEKVAKLKDLDVTCRWLFPLAFITGIFAFLVPVFFAGPLSPEP